MSLSLFFFSYGVFDLINRKIGSIIYAKSLSFYDFLSLSTADKGGVYLFTVYPINEFVKQSIVKLNIMIIKQIIVEEN